MRVMNTAILNPQKLPPPTKTGANNSSGKKQKGSQKSKTAASLDAPLIQSGKRSVKKRERDPEEGYVEEFDAVIEEDEEVPRKKQKSTIIDRPVAFKSKATAAPSTSRSSGRRRTPKVPHPDEVYYDADTLRVSAEAAEVKPVAKKAAPAAPASKKIVKKEAAPPASKKIAAAPKAPAPTPKVPAPKAAAPKAPAPKAPAPKAAAPKAPAPKAAASSKSKAPPPIQKPAGGKTSAKGKAAPPAKPAAAAKASSDVVRGKRPSSSIYSRR